MQRGWKSGSAAATSPPERDIKRLLDAVRESIDDPSLTKTHDLSRLFRLLQLWGARLTLYHDRVYYRPLTRTPEELAVLSRQWKTLQRMAASPVLLWDPGNPEEVPKPKAGNGADGLPRSFGEAMFSSQSAGVENKGEE
jgi:hypothetical protein